jgi:hypothetical protein
MMMIMIRIAKALLNGHCIIMVMSKPHIEQTCLTEDFHNMLDSNGWEEEGHEVVIAK